MQVFFMLCMHALFSFLQLLSQILFSGWLLAGHTSLLLHLLIFTIHALCEIAETFQRFSCCSQNWSNCSCVLFPEPSSPSAAISLPGYVCRITGDERSTCVCVSDGM